jgi:hypothetical protein
MTKVGKTRISHQSEETLHHIWSYLAYTGETLVFVIAGTIISLKVFEEDSAIGWKDWVKLPALYIILHLIRWGFIFILKWPISKMGYGLDWKQAIVLGYSGLRGAVSLILALIVYLDSGVNTYIKDIVFFHTAGIALMTLLINGTTIGFLVKKLGMMRMSTVKKKMLKNLIKAYRKETNEIIEELKERKNYGKIEWEILKQFSCAEEIRNEIFKKRDIQREDSDMQTSTQFRQQSLHIDKKEYTFDELYQEAKHRYLTTLKGIYWDFFSNGQCSSRSTLLLIESADRGIDHSEDELKDFHFIRSYFKGSWYLNCMMKLKNWCFLKVFVKNYLYNNISFVYDVTVNYVEAHEECMELIHQIVHNEEILDKLKQEIRKELKHAENKLYNELEENFPEVIKAVQHKRGGYYLINKLRTFVNEMIEQGQIDFKEAKFFINKLDKQEKDLALNKLKINFEEADADFEEHCELSKILNKEQIQAL